MPQLAMDVGHSSPASAASREYSLAWLQEVVARHVPVLHLHPADAFMPCTVEFFMEHSELVALYPAHGGGRERVAVAPRGAVHAEALLEAQAAHPHARLRLELDPAARRGAPRVRQGAVNAGVVVAGYAIAPAHLLAGRLVGHGGVGWWWCVVGRLWGAVFMDQVQLGSHSAGAVVGGCANSTHRFLCIQASMSSLPLPCAIDLQSHHINCFALPRQDCIDDVPLYAHVKEVQVPAVPAAPAGHVVVEALEINYLTFYAFNGAPFNGRGADGCVFVSVSSSLPCFPSCPSHLGRLQVLA